MPIQCLSNKYLERCGTQTGFVQDEDGKLCLETNSAFGIFVSRVYDSGERGTEWNRLELDISPNAALEVRVWIGDDMQEEDNSRGIEELYVYVEGNAQYVSNYREMLLYGKGCGRYARLAVKYFPKDTTEKQEFSGYRLTFPKESFTRYLPMIYQNNIQLERFLAVQESIYLGLERDIESFAVNMDYELCDRHLKKLAKWMGWGELAEVVDADILRKLLKTGISLISRKGTCSYYTELTEILIGKKAVIIEEPEIRRATLFIRERPEDGWEAKMEWVRKNVPIGIQMEIVVLHKTDRIDGQCFLDETAYLTDSELIEGGIDIDSIKLL